MSRFLRQIDLLDPKVCNETITIIGAGATGSFVALSLAKMGLSNIRVYDADLIEDHNFPNQLFPLDKLNMNKADALRELVETFTGEKIKSVPRMYERQPLKGIVVSALDTMSGRKQIYKNCLKSEEVKLIIDPRTGPEIFRIFSVDPSLEACRKAYEKTLHSDADADEAPCTGRSIIYSVLAVSAFVCKQIKHFLMKEDYKADIIMDMKQNVLMSF